MQKALSLFLAVFILTVEIRAKSFKLVESNGPLVFVKDEHDNDILGTHKKSEKQTSNGQKRQDINAVYSVKGLESQKGQHGKQEVRAYISSGSPRSKWLKEIAKHSRQRNSTPNDNRRHGRYRGRGYKKSHKVENNSSKINSSLSSDHNLGPQNKHNKNNKGKGHFKTKSKGRGRKLEFAKSQKLEKESNLKQSQYFPGQHTRREHSLQHSHAPKDTKTNQFSNNSKSYSSSSDSHKKTHGHSGRRGRRQESQKSQTNARIFSDNHGY